MRIDPHSNSDDPRKYRGAESILRASQKDPLLITERHLLAGGILNADEISRIRAKSEMQ